MATITDALEKLFDEYDVIKAAYDFFEDDWIQGGQAAKKELISWTQSVEDALAIAGKEEELKIWRNSVQRAKNAQVGTVLSTAEGAQALLEQIIARIQAPSSLSVGDKIVSPVSPKADLECQIRRGYDMIRQYRDILGTSSDPKEKIRSEKTIDEQWKLIEQHLCEYELLPGQDYPDDIVEIAAHFGSQFSKLTRKKSASSQESGVSQDSIIKLVSLADPQDFDYNDKLGVYLYKPNIQLRILLERKENDDPFIRSFDEPWVRNFPDPSAKSQVIQVYYGNIHIKEYRFVYVDGFNYLLPLPKSVYELKITPFQYHLGQILNFPFLGYKLENGLRIAGIKVEDST